MTHYTPEEIIILASLEEAVMDKPIWIKSGHKINLEQLSTRMVLTEKLNSKKAKESQMRDFFFSILTDCKVFKKHKTDRNDVFLVKSNEVLLFMDENNPTIFLFKQGFWNIFRDFFELHNDTEKFLIRSLKEILPFNKASNKEYKAYAIHNSTIKKLEDEIIKINIESANTKIKAWATTA